jgi:hypothetical protein
MNTFNYFIVDCHQDEKSDYKDIWGEDVGGVIEENEQFFVSMVGKWFEPNTALFIKGLDYLEGIEDEIEEEKWDENGLTTNVKFKNGSEIRVLSLGDSWKQCFILKADYPELNRDLKRLIDCF